MLPRTPAARDIRPRLERVPMTRTTTTGTAGVPDDDARRLASWIGLAAQGDQGAFARVYDETVDRATGVVHRVVGDPALAETVVRDAYLQVWRGSAGFEPSRGGVRAWVVLTAYRTAQDRTRRTSGVAGRRGDARVHHAYAALAAPQREVVCLAVDGGLTCSEVAQQLGLPAATVRARLRSGLHLLEEGLRTTRGT